MSDIISIIGIIISFIVAIYVHCKTLKFNKFLIKKDYFDKIFFDILYEVFPKTISKLNLNKDSFDKAELDKLHSNVEILKEKILFFRYYSGEDTYKLIKEKLNKIEDDICELFNFDASKLSIDVPEKILEKKSTLTEDYKALCVVIWKCVSS